MLCSQLCAQMELMNQTSWNRQPDIHSRTAQGSYHLCISPLSRPALNTMKPCKVPDKSLPSPVFLAGCKGGLDNETVAQGKSDTGVSGVGKPAVGKLSAFWRPCTHAEHSTPGPSQGLAAGWGRVRCRSHAPAGYTSWRHWTLCIGCLKDFSEIIHLV